MAAVAAAAAMIVMAVVAAAAEVMVDLEVKRTLFRISVEEVEVIALEEDMAAAIVLVEDMAAVAE